MRKTLECLLITLGLLASVCQGQGLLDQVSFRSAGLNGVHLYGATLFAGYSTVAYPTIGPGSVTYGLGLQGLGADVNYGASVSLGWQHQRQRTNLAILYSGTYAGMARYSDVNAFSHSLSLSASRRLTSKWTATLSGSGQNATLAEFLYEPSTLSVVSQLPASFDDLAAAFSIGQFSDAQVASMLTGAPILQSPARSLLLGNRILSYSAQVSLNYAYSKRLSVHFASFGTGAQSLRGRNRIMQDNYIMPNSTGANAGVGLAYSLSSRTQVGLDIEENRLINPYQAAYVTMATASLGRKMGMHWFLQVHGGGSLTRMTRQRYDTPEILQAVGGGSLGFRTYRHTLLASYERTSQNGYGFAVGTNTIMMGSWTWHRPGSRWNIFSSFGQEQMRNTGFASLSGWQGSAGVSEKLNRNTTLMAQYVYLRGATDYRGDFGKLSIHSIRVSLGWTPQGRRR